MNRVSLKCANCGNQDLEVEVNYFVPRAIELVCNYPGCGRVTPIAFFDTNEKVYGINGKETLQIYDDSYRENITPQKAYEALMKEN